MHFQILELEGPPIVTNNGLVFGETPVYIAISGNPDTLKVWAYAKEKLTTEAIMKLLLGTNSVGRTVWHLAGSLAIQRYYKKCGIVLNRILQEWRLLDFIRHKNYGRTAWHLATMSSNSETLQTLWERARKN